MPDDPNVGDNKSGETPPEREETRCLRCRLPAPVDEDGLCDRCLKEIDQACL